MASSGYTAITFVASEQPTTAKWNLIGSNDSSFNLGTGFEDDVIITRHIGADQVTAEKLARGVVYRRQGGNATNWAQHGTTNYDVSAADILIQCGSSVGSVSADTTVTFPVAFSATPIVTFGTELITDSSFPRIGSGTPLSTTGFAFSMVKTNSARAADRLYWTAIGPA